MERVWLITGANRGLGRAFAEMAVERGDKVIAAMRKFSVDSDPFLQKENVLPVRMDVTDRAQVESAVSKGIETFGRIDILINNAGYGLFSAFEEVSDEELRMQFETCFFGLANVTRSVVPYMRRQNFGRIINLSSIAGVAGEAGSSAYCTAKFAVTGLSECLNDELSDFNIQVMAVCPGPFRTDFRDSSSRKIAKCVMEEYIGKKGHRAIDFIDSNNHNQQGDPIKAAELIGDIAVSDNMPSKLMLGRKCNDAALAKLQADIDSIREYYDRTVATDFV